jgi:CubicO group peptidase (beta-lactamase class C family)
MFLPAFRRLTLLFVLLLGAGTLAAPAHAQDGAVTYAPTGAQYDGAISIARDSIDALMAEQQIPGLTAAVLVDGQIVWSEGFGWADMENQVPVTPLTKMRVGSVSKSMTGAALGVLLDRGQIDLDAPVQQYVPSFPEKRAPISTRQVAGHIAGIRHYRGDEFLIDENYDSVEEGLAIFKEDSLLFEPGAQFQYSSYGWNLVSAVVEGASGQDFLPFMRDAVFRPLNLRHTVADHTDSLITYRTAFYSVEDSVLINAPYVDNSYKWAGGGFLSTAEDLVRFGNAMINGGFFTPATRDELFTSLRTNSGERTGYGLGFFVGTDDAGRRTVGHSGGSVGGTTQLIMYPEQDVVVALIANRGGVDYRTVHQHIAALFME